MIDCMAPNIVHTQEQPTTQQIIIQHGRVIDHGLKIMPFGRRGYGSKVKVTILLWHPAVSNSPTDHRQT